MRSLVYGALIVSAALLILVNHSCTKGRDVDDCYDVFFAFDPNGPGSAACEILRDDGVRILCAPTLSEGDAWRIHVLTACPDTIGQRRISETAKTKLITLLRPYGKNADLGDDRDD